MFLYMCIILKLKKFPVDLIGSKSTQNSVNKYFYCFRSIQVFTNDIKLKHQNLNNIRNVLLLIR